MPTTRVDITAEDEWFLGEDKTLTFTVRDAAGAAITIAGWTLEYVLRIAPTHPTKKLTKTTSAGIALGVQSGATLGQCYVTVASADTDHLRPGTYAHGLARTNSGAYDIVIDGTAYLGRSAASPQSTT